MISIKTFLDHLDRRQNPGHPVEEQSELVRALLQGLHVLIEGLPLQSIRSRRPNSRRGLERMIAGLLRRLDGPLVPMDVIEIVSEAVTVLESDTKTALEYYTAQGEELQSMIAMLTDTVASLSVQTDSSSTRLQQIERQIERASGVEDIRALKSNLSDCLQAVKDAAVQQQKQSLETVQTVGRHIEKSKARLAAGLEGDFDDFEIDEEEPPEPRATAFAAVFLLDRNELISSRFGEHARHQVLALVRKRFKETLMPSDRIIRWKGATFIVLLNRVGSIEDVRAELGNIASFTESQQLDVGNRSVLLRISLSWTVFPQAQYASLDSLFKKVDQFLSEARNSGPDLTVARRPVRWNS